MALSKITELRTRIGLLPTDTSKDVKITDCYTVALLLVEDYLDRRILQETFTEQYTCVHNAMTKAWPIASINTIDGSPPPSDLRIDKERGIIYNVNWDNVMLNYTGGWTDDTIPAVIILTINELFDKLWLTTAGYGIDVGVINEESTVKKFTINGISVEYFGNSISGSDTDSMIPSRFRSLLDYYRRESLIGIG